LSKQGKELGSYMWTQWPPRGLEDWFPDYGASIVRFKHPNYPRLQLHRVYLDNNGEAEYKYSIRDTMSPIPRHTRWFTLDEIQVEWISYKLTGRWSWEGEEE
jgi:hypothetical protein